MKNRSKFWLYIIINILVSAATILIVLFIWDWTHPHPELTPLPESSISESNDNVIQPSSTPSVDLTATDVMMTIRKVVGAGNLEMEYVEIFNQSDGAVDLTGWQITDEDGNRFDFPTMILDIGGALTVHSKAGQNTVIELYWQSSNPIWQSGETAQLLESNGNLAATYLIP